ncbi:MAG: zf-HC2 domain-containing protein [Peptococcaceae bacterium]|jgi:hypothetical protein|nr:zf-HC2 domain-containing protein [Peptococcaceae bacterium]MDH7525866.1 zf-HC2 domain-containing protein [Peptococcaceae bacterium]
MCKVSTEILNEYIDGTIDPLERVVLEEHLKSCPQCRGELNRLKIVDWEMRRFFNEDHEIPPELPLLTAVVLQACFKSEAEEAENKGFSFKDAVELQVRNFRNSFKFLSLLPGINRPEKASLPPRKKKSVLRRIIGL